MASGWLESMKGKVAPLASRLGIGDEEAPAEQSLLQQVNEATTLDKTQRAIGFAVCVGIGLLLSFMAPMFIFRPTKFAAIYSLGNILSLCSTMFLMGPFTQIRRMFDTKRWLSTCIYLLALVLTLVSAVVLHSVILSILFIAIQFSAFIWYCASYIPYGQSFIKRMLGFSSADAEDG
ncbi:hypothetical protein COHA_003864 [Chlorella ohadii]|uniref:Vesicle transport protein n=1 Tax=Chlorella ohadii TaxID=2649997 RepID=A0AAD5H6Y1_9CHLO|nr:hypothetical protein COHA_003864 [Chlorella ohadii]